MSNCYLIVFAILSVLCNEPVMSSWDFAVTTKGQIKFYGPDWKNITSAAHQFDELSAITFDETEETIYFNDQINNNGSIYSLHLSADDNHRVEKIVQKTKDELIQGLAFDPLERILYWTDVKNKLIFQMSVDKKEEPSILIKLDNSKRPHGIAIDVCRRKLYWTNANHLNASIERVSLDGSNYEVLINTDLFSPFGIVVDQFTKQIFWVDDLQGDHFSVESSNLDGSDRKNITRKLRHSPLNLAIDKANVFWTDKEQNAVWRISKNATEFDEPVNVQNFTENPKDIIARTHFLSTQASNPECKTILDLIKNTILTPSTKDILQVTSPRSQESQSDVPKFYCLNSGYVNPKTNLCICPKEYQGGHCEIPICHNYCVEGTCRVSSTGYAQCECNAGFSGERCEIDRCNGYCLNGGHCSLENNDPNCQCAQPYSGRHCEIMDTIEMCERFCNKEMVEAVDIDLATVCDNCNKNSTSYGHVSNQLRISQKSDSNNDQLSSCNATVINKTAIFVSCGVVVSLVLVYIIVSTIRHVYKPLRPRIKKTYVVHKNVVPTPLTCRPTTEQCEITIENCCNMNICDTPCFDPKTMQSEAAKKEDKKTLLNHAEDLMY